MSSSTMPLPIVLTLFCWAMSWVRLTAAGSSCPADCSCWWKNNKATVECAGHALVALPATIDADTQVLNVSDNNLQRLSRDTFVRANLLNLQRIYMANCNVGAIEEGAFHRLSNLVELDLSRNQVPEVPSAALRDAPGLRRLILSQNPIRRLEDDAFRLLPSLVDLQLSRCRLEVVAPDAFRGLKGLTHLKLDANRLTTLSARAIQPLKGLHGVALHANPWHCDCQMREVKLWLTRYNVPYKLPPTCAHPARVKGYTLDELQLDDLACPPRRVRGDRRAQALVGRNATLVCEVTADPSPAIRWYRQGHPVANLTRFFRGIKMYVIYERSGGGASGVTPDKVSALTITAVSEQDAGDYVCVAENKAGALAANFTLEVLLRELEASGLTSGQIAGISLGLILVGAIVLLLICILLAKWRQAGLLGSEVKHPPLNPPSQRHKLVNSVNHVNEYKGQVKMSFSLPRLSRSDSGQRAYSDEAASDSDRTLVENLTSPSKSSTCNLSNKPDVVNVSSGTRCCSSSSSSAASKKDKKEKRQERKQKEKQQRKERHRWKGDGGAKTDAKKGAPPVPNALCKEEVDEDERKSVDRKSMDNRKVEQEENNRYGSYGDLKLSASNEWNKVISGGGGGVGGGGDPLDNAGFAREGAGRGESYELIEKSLANHRQVAPTDDGGGAALANDVGCNSLNRKSSARFRHYVPVLPPLPAQHYSQVRNSLIRSSCKGGDSSEDITDM